MVLKANPIVKELNSIIVQEIKSLNFVPNLKIILVEGDESSLYYANSIKTKSAKLGIDCQLIIFPKNISEEELLEKIKELNNDKNTHGIIVQKPLPSHINEAKINFGIDYKKDIDGTNPINIGKLVLGEKTIFPCTAKAVIKIFDFYQIKTEGENIVVLGRSNIVGKPLANILIQKKKNASVSILHSYTKNIWDYIKNADILIVAIGKANFLKSEMIPFGITLIDVGINQVSDKNGKTSFIGDIDFDSCMDKAKNITPVPGGVGSVTTMSLLENLVFACKNNQ